MDKFDEQCAQVTRALDKVSHLLDGLYAMFSPQQSAPPDTPDRIETILWLDLPMAEAIDQSKVKSAVAQTAKAYCDKYGLTMTGTPIVTHQDQFGPMDNVQVRHRIRMYAEPLTDGSKVDSEAAFGIDMDEGVQ